MKTVSNCILRLSICLLFLIVTSHFLSGSALKMFSRKPAYFQENKSPLDSIFKGGAKAFSQTFKSQIKYPVSAFNHKVEGALIFSITVSPKSGVRLKFLTHLHPEIEKTIARIVTSTVNSWIIKPTEYSLVATIFFSIGANYAPYFKEVEGFKTEFKDIWLEPFWNTMRTVTTRTRVSSSPSTSVNSTRSRLPTQTSDTRVQPGHQYGIYKGLKHRYEKQLKKENYKKAYQLLNEMIRFNPFDKQLIESRMTLEQELGVRRFRAYDEALTKVL